MTRPRYIGLGLFVALVLLIVLWDWNWLNGLVAARLSASLGRPVTIGYFDVRLARQPLLILDSVAIKNPPLLEKDGDMIDVNRISVRIDLRELWRGHLFVPEIAIEKPTGTLQRDSSGTPNWVFKPPASSSTSAGPDIGRFVISEGAIRVIDSAHQSEFNLAIHTEQVGQGQEDRLIVRAIGTYTGQPIDGTFIGGSILSLRDPAKPYPIDLTAANGQTKIVLRGTVADPMHFVGAKLDLELSGADLSQLYPLTGIPLAATPPYDIKGNLDYAKDRIQFQQISGTVGSSDLEGNLSVDPNHERIRVSGDLASKRVVLADLAGFIGGAPGKADAANATSAQRERKIQEQENPKLLPDKPIDLPKLRSADLDIRYKGLRIESESTPLDNVVANLKIENGALTLMPLSFGVGTGDISGNITLNGQQDLVHAVADIDFHHVDLHRIMESTKLFQGAGTIGGRFSINTTGNSLAQMLGRGNGSLRLFMSGGDISALLVALAGLDTGRAVITALGIPDRATVNCVVADAGLDQGVLKTNLLLFDTTEANIVGKGTIDLKNEKVDYQLTTDKKHLSIGTFNAPIDITGSLKSPSILPDPAAVAKQGALAAVFGVLLTPLGALIPTIELGLGKDNNCHQILASVETSAKRASHATIKPAALTKRTDANQTKH